VPLRLAPERSDLPDPLRVGEGIEVARDAIEIRAAVRKQFRERERHA
jgi:hypothetical protein